MHIRFIPAALAAAAFATGCHFAPSAEEVGDAVGEAVVTVSTQAGKVSTSAANMSGLGALGDSVGAIGERQRQLLEPLRPGLEAMADRMMPRLAGSALEQKAGPTSLFNTEDDLQRNGERLARFIRERIFIEDNEESRNLDEVIFRITGEDVCVYEDASGNWVPAGGSCVTEFDRYEVRVKARRPDDGIDLTLLLGPGRHAPFSLFLSRDTMAWTTDLAELKDTYLYFADVNQVEVQVPSVMVGRVRSAATRLGEDHYALAFSVLDEVKIEQAVGTAKVFFHTAAKTPVVSIEFNGPEKRLLYDLDLGVTTFGAPYSYLHSSTTTEKQMVFQLGGASASFDTREGDTELLVSHLGLGDVQSFWSLDGHKLFTLDLNASNGRHFDLRAGKDSLGNAQLIFSPGFDVAAVYALQPLQDDGASVAAWALAETLQVRVDGTNPVLKATPYDSTTGTGGHLWVSTGALHLVADEPGIAAVHVNEGQCLLYTYPDPYDAHPFAGYSAGSCP